MIEYVMAEILELSGNAAQDKKAVRLTPEFINTAIQGDEALHNLFSKLTFPNASIPANERVPTLLSLSLSLSLSFSFFFFLSLSPCFFLFMAYVWNSRKQ